jgi:glycolate oxidase iron-sulfur subunit
MPPLPADAPSADAARLVALADRCVQCGLCLPHCPTYRMDRIEAEGPRGRIAYAKALADGSLAPTAAGDRHLDQCLGCRRCEAACPAGVEYEALLLEARARQFERHRPGFAGQAALATLASPALGRLAFPLARLAGRLPALPQAPAISGEITDIRTPKGQLAIFRGCAGREYEAGTRWALATLAVRAGWWVTEIEGQGCCGTAAAHAGDRRAAAELAEGNRAAFGALPVAHPDRPRARDEDLDEFLRACLPLPSVRTVLSLASGCESILGASLAGVAEVVDAFVFLDREGGDLRFRAADSRIALHLPCSQRVLGNDAPLRRLLARIPGLDLVELPDTGCCGAAGLHMLSEPARAAAFRAPLLDAFAASGATQLLSANIGCRLHLASAIGVPVRHPVDFLAEQLA